MSEPAAIERRDPGDALSQIIGTGDTRAMLEQVEANVRDIIEVARDRGFVRRYGEGQHEFFGLPAWQLLGMTYGVTPFVEWSRPIDNGWEARAVVRTRDGQEIAAAEAMCVRTEPNRRNAPDHTLRAMAQTRANRNALRSCMGAALVLAGFDFADPEAPATKGQIGILHQLERDLGWSHDEAHDLAGVDSFKDLNRETAAELIDAWSTLRDDLARKAGQPESVLPTSPGISSTRVPPSDSSGADDHSAIGEPAPEYGDPPGDESAVSVEGKDAAATLPTSGDPHHADDDYRAWQRANEAPTVYSGNPEDNEPATPEQWERVPKNVKRVSLIKLASKLVSLARIPGPAPTSQSQFTRIQLARTLAAYLDGERG